MCIYILERFARKKERKKKKTSYWWDVYEEVFNQNRGLDTGIEKFEVLCNLELSVYSSSKTWFLYFFLE